MMRFARSTPLCCARAPHRKAAARWRSWTTSTCAATATARCRPPTRGTSTTLCLRCCSGCTRRCLQEPSTQGACCEGPPCQHVSGFMSACIAELNRACYVRSLVPEVCSTESAAAGLCTAGAIVQMRGADCASCNRLLLRRFGRACCIHAFAPKMCSCAHPAARLPVRVPPCRRGARCEFAPGRCWACLPDAACSRDGPA